MTTQPELLLRIVVIDPPAGVAFALQRDRDGLVPPTSTVENSLVFEFPVRVADALARPPRLVGAFTQGAPAARFVYINSGASAGQAGSCWTRRAKVHLRGISHAALTLALRDPTSILQTSFRGTARDGGPACASVPLLSDWTARPKTEAGA